MKRLNKYIDGITRDLNKTDYTSQDYSAAYYITKESSSRLKATIIKKFPRCLNRLPNPDSTTIYLSFPTLPLKKSTNSDLYYLGNTTIFTRQERERYQDSAEETVWRHQADLIRSPNFFYICLLFSIMTCSPAHVDSVLHQDQVLRRFSREERERD